MVISDSGSTTSGLHAAAVADLTGVSYRQLDHWTRQGYVPASVNSTVGRRARRLFAPGDVVLVAALARFARARINPSVIGPLLAGMAPSTDPDRLIVARLDKPVRLDVVAADRLRPEMVDGPPAIVFDPAATIARLGRALTPVVDARQGSPTKTLFPATHLRSA